jgi:hypothetical protein
MAIESEIKAKHFRQHWYDKDTYTNRTVWNEHTEVKAGGSTGYEYLVISNQAMRIELRGKHYREIKAAILNLSLSSLAESEAERVG